MKQFKRWLMLIICIIISARGFSQTLQDYVQVAGNTCDTVNEISGFTLDSIEVLSPPLHGHTSLAPTYWVYCPDTGFAGNDSMLIYACREANGVMYGCDTFIVYFAVGICSVTVNLVADSIPCANGGQHYTASASGGVSPYSYVWSDGGGDQGNCRLYPGVNLCVFVVDANNCTATNCTGTTPGCPTAITSILDTMQCGGQETWGLRTIVAGGIAPFSYNWSTGDTGSALCNVSAGNIYCLTVSDSTGCQIASCDSTAFPPCSLSVSLVADSVCSGGAGEYYTPYIYMGVSPFTYTWSDGTIGTGDCQLNAGTNLCVTVTDANGCMATGCTNNTSCSFTVNLTLDSTACNGQPGLITTVSGATGPYTYLWSPIQDTGAIMCGVNGAQLASGVYCVDVIDGNLCSEVSCYTVTGPGNCTFQYVQSNTNSQTIDFYGSYDSTFSLASVSWSFGDGTGSNLLNPIHNYVNYGTYYVTMNIYYNNGDSCSSIQYIYVYSDSNNIYPSCRAYFSSYISNDTVYFTDQSVYNPVTWQWDFGDGTGSTQQNPYHVYNSQGTWNVCLTITDTGGVGVNGTTGCSSSYCALTSNVSVQDMQAYLYHGSTVTPGYPLYVYLEYYNAGTELMNGTVVYRYPVGTTLSYAYPTPITNDPVNRLLTFSYDSLLPGSSNYIGVSLAADSNLALGSLVYDTMWVYPVVGDVTPVNNVSTIIDSVVGSWDPNGKSVSPKGRGEKGLIDASTPTVSYMIHFQNTGNAAAHQVIVRDTISDNIDMATVRVTYASFAYVSQIIGNQLVVSFENINLPDTGTSLLASQGYISVMANLKPGLAGGTQIFNTANIYFDANAPVITNTVINTLPGGILGINNIGNLEFTIMPNPANSEVLIRGEFDNTSTYELDDMLGRQLIQGRMTTTGAELNVADMSAGVYIVKVTSGDKTGAQRLVVVR